MTMVDILERLQANAKQLERDNFITNLRNIQDATDEIKALRQKVFELETHPSMLLYVSTIADERDAYRQQLTASQAREAKLWEALNYATSCLGTDGNDPIDNILALPQDDTILQEALKQAECKALMKVANVFDEMGGFDGYLAWKIVHRMIEETK